MSAEQLANALRRAAETVAAVRTIARTERQSMELRKNGTKTRYWAHADQAERDLGNARNHLLAMANYIEGK